MMSPLQMHRRDFHKCFGGGIVVLFGTVHSGEAFAASRPSYPTDFHAYFKIGEDGRVSIIAGKIEMGQGAMTSLARMAAEELGVDLKSVNMVLGDTEGCPWDMGTFGSMTSRVFAPALRAAAAKARRAIKALAASRLGVETNNLLIENGVVSVIRGHARHITFADLAKDIAIVEGVDEAAVLHSAIEFTVMGRSPNRLDGVEKVTGAANYTADIRLPGMLYAPILRPPMHGATLTQADVSAAEKMPGIRAIKRGDPVAVLHAEPDVAAVALTQIHAQWSLPEAKLSQDNIFDHILAAAGEQKPIVSKGDLSTASAARSFVSVFQKGYVAHAPMEPHAALADVRKDGATIWASELASRNWTAR